MAYAAVVSVKETIQRLQNSSSDHIISPQIIESSYDAVLSLQDVLKRLDSSSSNRGPGVNALEEQIKETAYKFEHALESHVYDKVNVDVDPFIQSLRMLRDEYAIEVCKELPEEEEEEEDDSPRIDVRGKMVGLDEIFGRIQYYLLNGRGYATRIVNLIGMAGIGKSTLARELFEDPSVSEYFDLRVWVKVGPRYRLEKVLLGILAQTNPKMDKKLEKEEMEKMVSRGLTDMRLLVVFDDVWGKQLSIDLQRLLPEQCESAIMLTTRSREAAYIKSWFKFHHYMEPMDNEESWTLLRDRVFGENKPCPAELEKPGKKIAEKCEGLPLTIVTIADILSTKDKTLEFWEMVAEKKNSVFKDAYDKMLKILVPSYTYLPQHLKACFLYLAVFPPNYAIPCSRLFMLWIAEGFLDRDESKTLEDTGMEYLEELVSENVVLVLEKSPVFGIKICSLHSVFWHLCFREATKIRFSHVMNTRADGLEQVVKSQRRFCVHNNVLFAVEDVRNSMASVQDARSLLCTGPHHRYPVSICLGLKRLKILDALTVRFYEFPTQVVKLIRLKYLALTCNENLPASISQLRNLQCLIVNKHMSIKSSENPSILPIEIWDMKELKHLHVMGRDLLDPRGAFLPNMLTLLNVGAGTCTKRVLRATPNLKELGVRIELAPDETASLSLFYQISRLHKLESLKCVVVNPKLEPLVVSSPPRLSITSSSLKELTLSGFGYPWKCITTIETLPVLEVLELGNYAFRGPKWETRGDGFPKLKVLSIEDSDLVEWTAGRWSFPELAFLTLKNCYKLQEMPRELGELITTIRVVDCSPFTEKGAKRIRYDQLSKEIADVDIYVHSSWNV